MNPNELKELIESGESQTVEFKENFDAEAIETAAAFANTKGGSILIGVSDKGQVKGIQVGQDTLKDWANRISQSTEPRVIPEIEVTELDHKKLVLIQIKEFPIKPISCKGKHFRRVGNSNRVMTNQEIAQMHFDSAGMSWDKLPAKDATLDDIDLDKVKKYVRKANTIGRKNIEEDEDPIHVLEKMELIQKGQPAWAAILLFRKDNHKKFLPMAAIHCGRFKEETQVIDDLLIQGTLAEQIEEAMDFIRKNLKVKFVVTGKPEREEIWEYPLQAIREALINAVCHRDYTASSNTDVRIYDDEIVIWNPGGLPNGLKIEQLFIRHNSVLRNKGIGPVFYDMKLIEQWGRGIGDIRKLCSDAGLPEPIFEEYQQGFRVTFRKDVYTEDYLHQLGLNERQIKAVLYVKAHGKIINKEYQKITEASKPTATLDLMDLVKKNILSKVGAGRATAYILERK